jgi:hypothetical protein
MLSISKIMPMQCCELLLLLSGGEAISSIHEIASGEGAPPSQ